MNDDPTKILAQLDREGTETLDLAGLYARTLESLAQRIQSTASAGTPTDRVALRSSALRLNHAATEGIAALVSVVVQSARLDLLATIRSNLEAADRERERQGS